MVKSRAEQLVFFGFLALICWAPLPFGSNRPWGAAVLFEATALLVACWLLLFLAGKVPVPGQLQKRAWLPLLLLSLVQLWVFIQTVPLPRAWVALLSPRAEQLHLPAAYIPLSLDVALTRFYLLQGITYTLGFLLAVLLLTHRGRIEKLLWTVVLCGAFQAGYGVLMTLSGLEYGFFVEKYTGLGVATGTFINRNHFAGYMVMCLAAGTGLLISRLGGETVHTGRQKVRAMLVLLFSSKFQLRLMLAMMVTALVLTHSRMGNLGFFVALCVAGGALLVAQRRRPATGILLLLGSLLVVDLAIVGQWFGAEEVAQRLLDTRAATESRDEVAQFTLALVQDFPLTGSGGGTWYTVFPHYSGKVLQGDYYVHAHNDFLELAGDLGLPVYGILAMFVLLTFKHALEGLRNSESRFERGLGFTVLMLLVWVLLHSAADFNLHVTANAFTFPILASLVWLSPLSKAK